jgi:hypothetical protein
MEKAARKAYGERRRRPTRRTAKALLEGGLRLGILVFAFYFLYSLFYIRTAVFP